MNFRGGGRVLSFLVAALFLYGALLQKVFAGPSLKGGHYLVPGIDGYRLIVKIKPALIPDVTQNGSLQFPLAKSAASVSAFGEIVNKYNLTFKRLLQCTTEELRTARSNGGKILNRNGYDRFQVRCLFEVISPGMSREQLLKLAQELEQYEVVEYSSLEAVENPPPPVDYSPTTPSFLTSQTYRASNPGIDVTWVWSTYPTVRGQGLMIADLEHSWGTLTHSTQQVHEDLHNQNIAYGLPWMTDDFRDHGMAVMGLILAGDNGYGITGSVPQARGLVYSIMHGDATALDAAIDSAKAGDIILMEMQRTAPDGNLGPPDVIKTLWDLIKPATARGVVVVETAGNGSSNMDHSSYATYHSWGDNGAIIEGAGTSNTAHNRMSYSSYGARVNMQGWGENVFTLGYSNGWSGSTDWRQSYTASFGGTSSSGPVVTSAVALCQSYAKERKGRLLTSIQIRDILMATGNPQGTGVSGHIGPLPNLRAAFTRIDSLFTTGITEKIILERTLSNGLFYTTDGTIHYCVSGPVDACVTLALFDLKGSLIATLFEGQKSPGLYKVSSHSGNSKVRPNAGIYLCTMQNEGKKYTSKIIIK